MRRQRLVCCGGVHYACFREGQELQLGTPTASSDKRAPVATARRQGSTPAPYRGGSTKYRKKAKAKTQKQAHGIIPLASNARFFGGEEQLVPRTSWVSGEETPTTVDSGRLVSFRTIAARRETVGGTGATVFCCSWVWAAAWREVVRAASSRL